MSKKQLKVKNGSKPKTASKNKQVKSATQKAFRLGQILNTKDEYLPQGKKPRIKKAISEGKKEKRTVLVVDTNKAGDSGYTPLRGKPGADRTKFRDTYVKHYFETTDNEGKPVNPNNKKFKASNLKNFSRSAVLQVRKILFDESKQKDRNERKYKSFHKRDK